MGRAIRPPRSIRCQTMPVPWVFRRDDTHSAGMGACAKRKTAHGLLHGLVLASLKMEPGKASSPMVPSSEMKCSLRFDESKMNLKGHS